MKTVSTIKEIKELNNEEIIEFFANTTFRGNFSHTIRNKKNPEYYCGSIDKITINGKKSDLCPYYLNVPVSCKLEEGPCEFNCKIILDAFREKQQYITQVVARSLRNYTPDIDSQMKQNLAALSIEERTKDLFERWGVDSCEFIGYYCEEDNQILIKDLHKVNFDRIPYYPDDEQHRPIVLKIPNRIPSIKLNNYYLFKWKLADKYPDRPFLIFSDFDFKPRPIEPQWFIDKLFSDRYEDKSKNFGSATNFLDTLSKQLSAKESTFIYELLQNANDYPCKDEKVDVEFHITDKYLLFLHSGDYFNIRNISGICGINEKEKAENKKTIGYKGIGFKTVFLNNHYVYLNTGKYSFRFDERAERIKRIGAPWPILPIWTDQTDVDSEVANVFKYSDKKFRVQLALRPNNPNTLHRGKNSYECLLKDIFEDSNLILFVPNINSVKVFINGTNERTCNKNTDNWLVSEYEESISPELQEIINKKIETGKSRIPEKYIDFTDTKVSFACKKNGTILEPIENGLLYCYLPTSATWGFPFLLNSDMIPKGDRDDIETEVKLTDEINFNSEISKIAGSKFFDWIKDLLTSKEFEVRSVFSLIPNFDTCKKEHSEYYDDFIFEFRNSFENKLWEHKFIPVQNDIVNIKKIIFDKTGLSEIGIISDEALYSALIETNGSIGIFPLSILRDSKEFKSFLNRYIEDEQKFDWDDLKNLIKTKSFNTWLKNQINNNCFLEFLLKKNKLEDFIEEDIFIESSTGDLKKAADLFYDIDEHLVDLKEFEELLPHLSIATREYFKANQGWSEVIENEFYEFNPKDFVYDILLNRDEFKSTSQKLLTKPTSLCFYKFLAKNEIKVKDDIKSLPFFNDNNEPVDGFEDSILFFSSKHGHKVAEYDWLSNVSIEFVSSDYEKIVLEYFRNNLNVHDFTDEFTIKEIILNDDYHNVIVNAFGDDFNISKSFIDYCYIHKDMFNSGDLRKYTLKVYDGDGDTIWCLSEDHVFFSSSIYDNYSTKEWIDYDWMYALDKDYYTDQKDIFDYKKFLSQMFWIAELEEKNFYKDVVKKNLKNIISNTNKSSDRDGRKNIDFIKYLDDNYNLIFEEEKDTNAFVGLILVDKDLSDVDVNTENLYIWDDELVSIVENDWFPKDLVTICNSNYGKSKALIAIGVKNYKFGDFFDDVIVEGLSSINEYIDGKDKSIAFHNFIIEHLNVLTPDQQSKMISAKVFLHGQDDAADTAGGHKILSSKAKELFDKGLVEFSDLDIIDPDYKTEKNVEYWETRLGNTKFTVSHFFTWLKDNFETFIDTLQNEKLNIEFWRWLKDNVGDKLIEEAANLPVLLKDGSIDSSDEAVYFSDEYMLGAGIESLVIKFNEDALFISPNYIEVDDNIEEWKTFWEKVGIKYEIVDILVETIIPLLSEIEDDCLPKLLASNREALEKCFEDGLITNLTHLRLKAHDGEFYDISDTIYIDCEKEEPFPYIELPNQISYNSSEERRLIKDLIVEVDGVFVSTLSEWQQRKLDCYLAMQTKDRESVRGVHYRFINDLSTIRNSDREVLKEIERINEIFLLNRDNKFCEASTLTMGSTYKPFFDFEECGVNSLNYVTDLYDTECSEYVGKLFRVLNVHSDFIEDNIDFLKDRKCSIYFWSKYLIKKDASISRIKLFISDKLLDDLACIPTKDYMKTPKELYFGDEVSKYVKGIEDWENKIPLKDLPSINISDKSTLFDELPFKNSLDFLDALYALISINGQDRRTQLLEWMIDGYDDSFYSKIHEYREDERALWRNNKNENVQIKDLYALDYSDKTLELYFGTNSRIVNKQYFPTGDLFKKACDILGIKTITDQDLKMEPVDESTYSERDSDLKLFALVIAGISDNENWQSLYESYCEKLSVLNLHNCSSILITYNEDDSINQSLRKFFHQEGSNDFYFVKSLDSKRVYTSFVSEYMKFLNISEDDVSDEVVEDIMDSRENALEIIKEQNTLMLDDDFKNELEKLCPGIKRQLSGKKAEDDKEEDTPYRPTFTTKIYDNDSEGYIEDDNENTIIEDNANVEVCQGDNTDEDINEPDETNYSPNSYGETDARRQSSSASNADTKHETDRNKDHAGAGSDSISKEPRKTGSDDDDYDTSDDYEYIGSDDKDPEYEPIGRTSRSPRTRYAPKPFTKEELNRLRSNGSPLELESLAATEEEINVLAQYGITAEQIADTNYLAQLRLYWNLTREMNEEPLEDLGDFIKNAADVSIHALKSGRYIHACSAARGVMYTSPSVWSKMVDDKWTICVYLDGRGKNFHYINSAEEFLKLVEKDDVVIKITGKDKVNIVNKLYSGLLGGVKGSAYTLIRVAARTNMDAVFAHYIGSMAEKEDGNEDVNEF